MVSKATKQGICYFEIGLFILFALCVSVKLFQYWLVRHAVALTKRYWEVVVILNVVIIVYLLVEKICGILEYSDVLDDKNLSLTLHIRSFVFVSTPKLVVFCFLCRAWHLYYDIQFALSSESGKWTQYIDKMYQVKNWFYMHKQWYGSLHWSLTRVFIPVYVISQIVTTLWWHFTLFFFFFFFFFFLLITFKP
ncbi:hypothetical protein RFI_09665 [Reticulomyxa filosa]|uniref:Uncharacterized protein n=1 Tax=Reticulomyxa filosa TaxID=46433 RepID=X6NNG7_RETFI|nr:hypothetical protein RFI_09665 [Reticulomyxa filosa]|eukprot:ETO27468.1 hypothetical protein RFI_09665 [Reticulomyxa filosa]